jgi:hypothetical protein
MEWGYQAGHSLTFGLIFGHLAVLSAKEELHARLSKTAGK